MHYFRDAQTSRMLQPTCYDIEFDKDYFDKFDPGKVALLKHKMQVSQRANEPRIVKAIVRQKLASIRLRIINMITSYRARMKG